MLTQPAHAIVQSASLWRFAGALYFVTGNFYYGYSEVGQVPGVTVATICSLLFACWARRIAKYVGCRCADAVQSKARFPALHERGRSIFPDRDTSSVHKAVRSFLHTAADDVPGVQNLFSFNIRRARISQHAVLNILHAIVNDLLSKALTTRWLQPRILPSSKIWAHRRRLPAHRLHDPPNDSHVGLALASSLGGESCEYCYSFISVVPFPALVKCFL